jgi:hypothetical protein
VRAEREVVGALTTAARTGRHDERLDILA